MKAEYKAILENLCELAVKDAVLPALELVVKDSANQLDDLALATIKPLLLPLVMEQLDKIDGVVGDAVSAPAAAPAQPQA